MQPPAAESNRRLERSFVVWLAVDADASWHRKGGRRVAEGTLGTGARVPTAGGDVWALRLSNRAKSRKRLSDSLHRAERKKEEHTRLEDQQSRENKHLHTSGHVYPACIVFPHLAFAGIAERLRRLRQTRASSTSAVRVHFASELARSVACVLSCDLLTRLLSCVGGGWRVGGRRRVDSNWQFEAEATRQTQPDSQTGPGSWLTRPADVLLDGSTS